MRTSNPLLRADTFDLRAEAGATSMTIMGTVHKTALLVLAVFGSAIWSWNKLGAEGGAAVYPWLIGSVIASLVLALVTHWKKHLAYLTAPAYALCEGVILGAISALFEQRFPERDGSSLNNVAWYCCIRLSTMGRFPTFANEVANAMMQRSGDRIDSNSRDTVALSFFCAGRVDEAVEQQRTALGEHRGDHRFEGRLRRYEDAQRRRQQNPPPASMPAAK